MHALQDYQMQLMLLEQQNKHRKAKEQVKKGLTLRKSRRERSERTRGERTLEIEKIYESSAEGQSSSTRGM